MKYLVSCCLSLLSFSFLHSQNKNNPVINVGVIESGNTYAVIVGISNYENENINLNFANRDATVFADFLRSKAGGLVPAENIRLLTDTNATTAAIYNSLNWLRDQCELSKIQNEGKPCQVYFYFSGHGDVETDTKANLGFLIAFNTPPNNYINNAVRIEDLNNYAHTLSVDLNANVIIITDACHSGKLAGSDNKGTFLVGRELSAAKEKEIRIASCLPDELSNEDERWGGGRGVFSWYLINGLQGLADKNKDNIVTLNEIKTYVESSIAADPILKAGKLKQSPVLEGNRQFRLAEVDIENLNSIERSLVLTASAQAPGEYFFSKIKNNEILESLHYDSLNALPRAKIAEAFIRQVSNADPSIDPKKINQLRKNIASDTTALKLFNADLAEVLHTKGQQVINLYLEGDAAELERRRYYNSSISGYDIYPKLYSLAIKLTEPDNPLSRILMLNQLYFTGINARLKMPLVSGAEQSKLLDKALAAQTAALNIENNAAYIQNELGILYYFKKDLTQAEKYYTNATMLAPDWSVPWANLSGLYADLKKKEQALAAGQTAERLQPGLQLASANLGYAYEVSGNLLFAEEYYRQAIDINSRHYFPFERLGFVYMNTTQYALADSFFYEADLRKRGYHFKETGLLPVPFDRVASPIVPFQCNVDSLHLDKTDIMAFFTWGVQEYKTGAYDNAQRILKKVIALDRKNPLVYHYMGKLFYDQKKWEEAELMFKLAVVYYRDEGSFKAYCDSIVKARVYAYSHDCYELFFRTSYYKGIEDEYFLGTLYESWAHYEEAETHFRNIIRYGPAEIGGYLKYWMMLEKLGRFTEAESVIRSYSPYNSERTHRELNNFYRRAINKFPENPDWHYRLGLLLYERAAAPSMSIYLDTIIWFPKQNKEIFIDTSSYPKIGYDLNWDVNVTGTAKLISKPDILENEAVAVVPGTLESFILAGPIYTPRKDAILYLTIADSMITDTDTKAAINFKIGNVFVRSGSKKQAFPYFSRSVELSPGNASARLNLVDVSEAIYKNRAGLEQLDYLYAHKQINFPKRMLYAKYNIYAARFDSAKKILDEANLIYPYELAATYDLMGRLYLLSDQTAKAILTYGHYLSLRPNNSFTQYTLAKLYARSGFRSEAWDHLEYAMKNGFNYMYILNTDPDWSDFRKDTKWKTLLQKYPPRKYEYPELSKITTDKGKGH